MDIQVFEDVMSEEACAAWIDRFHQDDRVQADPEPDYSQRRYLNISLCPDWFSLVGQAVEVSGEMASAYFARPDGMEEVVLTDWLDDGFIMAHYRPGDDLALHFDGQSSEPGCNGLRLATCLIFLNSAEGGELYFPRQDRTIAPKVGTGVMFPVDFTHPHGVRKVVSDRYILQTWLTDPRYAVVERESDPQES